MKAPLVIVWRPLEHISAYSSKIVDAREKVLSSQEMREFELPFGDIAAVQWLTTRPTEARVCVCPTDSWIDRSTFYLRSQDSKML